MNKKFLSAILFGALMVTSTGTFVSCKDYDDDIDDLQEQINKLATKEDMTSQIAALQTALDAAKTEAAAAKTSAEEAVKKATSAESSATEAEKAAAQAALDAANAKAEAIKAAQDEVAKVKAELEASIDSKFEASKNEFAETIAELTKKVEELTGYTTGMVTGLSFQDKAEGLDPALDVNYARIAQVTYPDGLVKGADSKTASSYEFGKGLSGSFTIANGDVNTVPDYMLVNVDPVNAVMSTDMLSLINGKGESLNNYVNMTCDVWSGDLIKSRAASSTGLRKVGVQLKNDINFEDFDKLVLPDGEGHHQSTTGECNHNYVAYALAVTDIEKARTVTSSYDVTLHVQEEKKALRIEEYSKIESSALNAAEMNEIKWFANGEDALNDEGCCPVVAGEPFTISVNSAYPSEGGRVMASYIIVDYDNSKLSTTDKAAIKGLTFTGVDEVTKTNTHSITMSGSYVAGVAVPLKLVTVDYTGNIEVNIIWVKAGEPALLTADFTMTPKTYVPNGDKWSIVNEITANDLQEFKIPANTDSYSVSLVAGEQAHVDGVHMPSIFETALNESLSPFSADFDVANGSFLKLYKDKNLNTASNASEVAYAAFVGDLNLQMMKEGKTYEGVVKFYDKTGTYLGTNTIKVTKVLPTVVPSDFSAKTNAISESILTIYPEPQNDGKGEFELNKAFNNWTEHYDISIKDVMSKNGAYDKGYGIGDNSTAKIYDINKDLINNGKSYASTIKYDYGFIQYIPEGHGTTTPDTYWVSWNTSFSTKFGCLPYDSKYTWSKEPVVYYREDVELTGMVIKDADGNVTSFSDVIKVTDPYGKVISPFASANDTGWTTWAPAWDSNTTIKLITNTDRVNEFFTAQFDTKTEGIFTKATLKLTRTSTEVVLSGDVTTKVVVVTTDNFGHPHEIEVGEFVMKKAHE